MSPRFTKKIENFVCGHCGAAVEGTGYTNHCPKCLWSKHVDVNPGDRAEACDGLMRPVEISQDHQKWFIMHRCERCGFVRRNRLADNDNFDEAVRLEKIINEKKVKGW